MMTSKVKNTGQAAAPAKVSSRQQLSEQAAVALPEQDEAGKVRAALLSAKTPAEWQQAGNVAAAFVSSTSKAAWQASLLGRRSVGESLYGLYSAKLLSDDPNTVVKSKQELTFTQLMSAVYGIGKDDYQALPIAKRQGPGRRPWSSLSEDYSLFVLTVDDLWLPGYEAQQELSEDGTTVNGYIAFARRAEQEQARLSEDEAAPESSQIRSARTKRERQALALAEQQRQAAAKKAASDEAARKADEAATKLQNVATGVLRHVSEHPSSNLVTGVELTCAAAAALSVSKLRELSDALLIIAAEQERIAAATPATPAAEPQPAAEQQPEPLTVAAADEAASSEGPSLAEQLATLQQQLATLASAMVPAT